MILTGAAGADAHPDELPWPPDEPPSILMILITLAGADEPPELPPKLKKLACAAQKQRARTTNTFIKIKLPLVINQMKNTIVT